MKKTYIGVKCGLSRDPKHRQAMGECVWLFLHMIDTADWDSGTVKEWKDEAAAEAMGMPIRTLREQRRKLAELGYITCVQKQYDQDIVIHNWTNPREYSGEKYNPKRGSIPLPPQLGDTQGDTQGSSQDGTPTYSSTDQPTSMDEVKTAANKKVDAYLQLMNAPGLKKIARVDAILSFIAVSLNINTETKRWKEFAEYVDNRQQKHGENIERFMAWVTGQPKFDIQFWPPSRMQEFWPQAFIKEVTQVIQNMTEEQDWRKGLTF